jgi:glycogen debranching enzyme
MAPSRLCVLDGSSYFLSSASGDLEAEGPEGFFHADVRHLSTWRLLVDGSPLHVLSATLEQYHSLTVAYALAGQASQKPPIVVMRRRVISDGVHEEIRIHNFGMDRAVMTVELEAAADFADVFEVADGTDAKTTVSHGERTVCFARDHSGCRRETRLEFDEQPRSIDDGRVAFTADLPPGARWRVCMNIVPVVQGRERRPRFGCDEATIASRNVRPNMPASLEEWIDEAPRLTTSWRPLERIYRRSLVDLASLRFRLDPSRAWSLPAAGLPKFMALLGRDALITSYHALLVQPRLARTTLEALAALQATEYDDFHDAEPGKIVHEVRRGILAEAGDIPHAAYYGTHDATLWFLILLDEYERWTGDVAFVAAMEGPARAAIEWMERWGDPDGDGYLEYRSRSSSPKALRNQGWRDSGDGIVFPDGTIAEPPIATCEIQGYAYDARCRAARLAREIWHDAATADRLERDAHALRERFQRDFWSDEIGAYVLALDGAKKQVRTLASNMGHLLWSGIADPARAAAVVERLMEPHLFTGWGTRTVSSEQPAYNPIGYHRGTVWPHDTAIVAEGMRRYGFAETASTLAFSLLQAADRFEGRLPECFSGIERDTADMPVAYPDASSPQAWASAAPFLCVRTLLGVDPAGDRLGSRPWLPTTIGQLRLSRVRFRGDLLDIPFSDQHFLENRSPPYPRR